MAERVWDNYEKGQRDKGNYKRNRRGGHPSHQKQRKEDNVEPVEMTPALQAFKGYQAELDRKHDKYERLVKLSRDITIESKRIIFLLHRIDGEASRNKVVKDAEEKLKAVESNLIAKIAHELKGEDLHQFLRAFSPGLQEYIEALSFCSYLKEERLISRKEIASRFIFKQCDKTRDTTSNEDEQAALSRTDDSGQKSEETTDIKPSASSSAASNESAAESEGASTSLELPPLEYMLGLADFTGELMRLCINTIGGGDLERPFHLVSFTRAINEGFQLIGNLAGREMVRKSSVMRQSLKKMEDACYVIRVRGSEIPQHMLKDALFSPPEFASHDSDFKQEEMVN
ncbi:translin-associated protein X-like [Diadema setosum]|uniref:translin-associated protein X-like n=1 Tax=Diadema setosum TaxID=31175 RepID=UPI003B3B19CE